MIRLLKALPVIAFLTVGVAAYAGSFTDDSTFEDFSAARLLSPDLDDGAERGTDVVEYSTDDLEAFGARDAAEALAYVSEGFINRGDTRPDRLEPELRLRGRDPRALVVYVDGVPVDHIRNGSSDLARIPIRQVALIRVSTGSVSSRYGADADAGVVEILTRRIRDRFSTRFETDWGSTRSLLYSLWMGDTQGVLNYYGAASHDEQQGDQIASSFDRTTDEDGGLRENSDFRRDSFLGRTGLEFDEKFRIYVGGSYDQDEGGIPSELTRSTNETDRIGHRRRATGRAFITARPNGFLELRAAAYLSEDAERLDRYSDRDATNLFHEYHEKGLRGGVRLLPTVDFGPWSRLRLGFDWRSDKLEAYRQGLDPDQFLRPGYFFSIEDDVRPARAVTVSIGTAYQVMGAEFDSANITPDSLTLTSPRASVVLGPFGGFEPYLAASQSGRFPTLDELFDTGNGNPDLEPEKTTKAEAGLRFRHGESVDAALIGFGSQTADIVRPSFDQTTETIGPLVNDGDVQTVGATLRAAARPVAGMFLRGSYTLLSTQDRPDKVGLPDNKAPLNVPAHVLAALAAYRSPIGLGGSLGWRYVSDRRDDLLGVEDDLPYYSTADARIFYNYRDNLEIWLAGSNITDVYYELPRHQPAAGRFIHGGIKLTY